ncbi:hypothetical protein GGS26DRAFT_586035 [Hypomontagnella submonticulosa]|nr:hypothetical protein GGS26DRAFT_586035 [Hypomontagnella submonticulosa]
MFLVRTSQLTRTYFWLSQTPRFLLILSRQHGDSSPGRFELGLPTSCKTAKERAGKPRKEKAEKSEKVSQDNVKKHKKDKKSKRAESPGASDNGYDEVKDIFAVADELVSQPSATDPALDIKSDKKEKSDKTEKKKSKKSRKASIEAAIAGVGSSYIQLPVRPASNGSEADGGAPLLTIDVQPSKVDPKAITEKAVANAIDADRAENEEERRVPGYDEPPGKLNRRVRRRIELIERQRERIQKMVGVTVGSSEKADEVQARLDRWVEEYYLQASINKQKKRQLNAKQENARLKSMGRQRRKEAKKEIRMAKKVRAGLSAPKEV